MKNKFLNYSIIFSLLICVLGCSSDDKLVEAVLSEVNRGAILRTIAIPNPTFDFNDTSSQWSVTVEEQDLESGGLLDNVDIYVQLLSDNGNSQEMIVKTIAASSFVNGPLGLPRTDISLTLAEALGVLGLQPGDFTSQDQFNIRLQLNLTTGQSFTATDANPNVSGGNFFSSPYNYRAQFFCTLTDASIFDGSYSVVSDVWADYSEGDVVPVEQVPNTLTFRILSTNNPFINNTDTSYIEVTINPEDGSVTAASNEPFDYGSATANVTGSGSVGTCTGDISLVLDFTPLASAQGFVLTKN